MVWALVAAGGLFWGLRLFVTAAPVPPSTPVAANGPAVRGDLTRLLGADPPPPVLAAAAEPPPDARFQLIGVVAPRAAAAAREGVALIAVDGKPAKAYRVGAVIDGLTTLKSVATRGAMLGPRDGAAQVTLNLAPPAAANTGALPSLAPPAPPAPEVAPGSPASPSRAGNPGASSEASGGARPLRRTPQPAMPVENQVPAENQAPFDPHARPTR